ncbi:MAG: hypothetical protein K6A32_03605 [Bacteroidales bacterium]|nr:hypothetical protein [Bacteroidales bacterium]
MDQHYHPLVYARLQQIFATSDWEALPTYLNSLSNAHFRTAGYLIGERCLSDVPEEVFWEVALQLITWQPKAFTVTVAKAAKVRLLDATLSLSDPGFVRLAASLRKEERIIDRQKLLMQWLPAIPQPEMMEQLFEQLGIHEPRRRVDFLIHINGLPAAFVLLRTLRFEEYDSNYLTGVCRQLIRRASQHSTTQGSNDSLSFNLASLLRTYFDLPDIRGTFSLALEPYELSRLDTDYEVFKRILTKV